MLLRWEDQPPPAGAPAPESDLPIPDNPGSSMKPNFPCSGSDRYSTEIDTARWPLAGSPSVESCRTPRHRGRRGGGDRRRLSRGETQNRSAPVAVVVVVETHQAEIVCSCVGKISHRLPERLRLRVRDPHRTTREVT